MKWVRIRLLSAATVLTGLLLALVAKAWTLQIRDGAKMRALGEEQYLQQLILPSPRGSIHDANGVELAVSVDVPSAFVNPRELADVAGSAAPVAQALDMDVRDVEEKLASPRHFEWLRRHVTPEQARKVRALGLGGIGLAMEPRRFYPAQPLAASVLGSADVDGRGVEGIELSLDEKLRGERARLPVLRDRRGEVVVDETPLAKNKGAMVQLTIDRFVQFTAERALAECISANKAKGGMIVVLDPRSGAVLALASTPDGRNRPVVDAFEPGSVMKVFSVVAALDAGAVTPTELFDVAGGIQIGKHTITDTHKGLGVIPVSEIIKVSSNVGATKIARKLGKERLHDALVRLGFGARTGIELPGEARGRVRDAATWGEAGLATISFGYGMMASPLQVAAALAAVANGGTWYRPTIVKSIVGGDGIPEKLPPADPKPVLSEKSARAMVEMLKAVVQKGGTASHVVVPGFVVAGKTGTAYKHDPVTRAYSHDRYLASFIGFAPADDARAVIVVMIDEPSAGKHMGGDVAAPVFAAVAAETMKYLGVPATAPVTAAPPPAQVDSAPEPVPEIDIVEDGDYVVIPDFAGLSVAQALALAQGRGLRLEVQGSGRATRQFPPPGRAVKSITCRVTFER